ncbi:unnamed protein product [Scytosiphon promiscuus]
MGEDASVSTIDSTSTRRRRDRNGVTTEWNGSLLSTTEEVPGEALEALEAPDGGGGSDTERERGSEGESDWRGGLQARSQQGTRGGGNDAHGGRKDGRSDGDDGGVGTYSPSISDRAGNRGAAGIETGEDAGGCGVVPSREGAAGRSTFGGAASERASRARGGSKPR